MKISKYKRSNIRHETLSRKNNDIANRYSQRSKENFISLVKRDYHDLVILEQNKLKRVLTKDERKKIFKNAKSSLIDYRKSVNKDFGFGRYIPKKNN